MDTHVRSCAVCVCTCERVAVCTCRRVYTRAHVYMNTCVVWAHVHMWALQSRFFNIFGGGEAPWVLCVLAASHLPLSPGPQCPAVPLGAAGRAWLVSDQHGGSVGTLVSAVERDIGGPPPEPKTPCSGRRLK